MGDRRVRVRIRDVEVDIEGDAEFVESHRPTWEPLLALAAAAAREEAPAAPLPPLEGEDPFAEYGGRLSTEYDRVLAACYHVQQHADGHSFRWPDVSRVLIARGMDAQEAASEFQYLVDARLVLKLNKGTFRVAAKGVEALHKLAAKATH